MSDGRSSSGIVCNIGCYFGFCLPAAACALAVVLFWCPEQIEPANGLRAVDYAQAGYVGVKEIVHQGKSLLPPLLGSAGLAGLVLTDK